MAASTKLYQDGEVIFREGERSLYAYVIAQGRVTLTKQTPDGERIQVATLGQGELFGEMGVIDRGTRSATATASGTVSVEEISRMDFRNQLESNNSLAMTVIENLVVRLRKTDELLVNITAVQQAGTKKLPEPPEPQETPTETTQDDSALRSSERTSLRRKSRRRRGKDDENEDQTSEQDNPNALTTTETHDGFATQSPMGSGFLNRLVGGIKNAMMAASESTIDIFVAKFHGDRDGWLRNMVISALSEVDGLNVRPLDRDLPATDPGDTAAIRNVQSEMRPIMQSEHGNLLIWGGISPDGNVAHMHFTPDNRLDNTLPGLFLPNHVFYLPSTAGEKAAPAIRAIALGALILQKRSHAQWLQTPLPKALKAAGESGLPGLDSLPPAQQASTLVCIGNAMATAGRIDLTESWLERAIRLYLDAANHTDKDKDKLYGSLTISTGLAYHIVGERKNNADLLRKAVFYLSEALEKHPFLTQVDKIETTIRIGQARHRIALLDSDEDEVKQSMADFRKALDYFTRTQHPLRWAELISALAQCMQLFGTLVHNADALERSVQLCLQALEVRKKETYPLLWAASQNNMASALFMLARHNNDPEYIKKAAELFEEVKEIYKRHGMKNQAALAEKNKKMALHTNPKNTTQDTGDLEWRLELAKPLHADWQNALQQKD